MTNAESKAQYEGAILQQLIKNAEDMAVIKFEAGQLKTQVNALDEKVDTLGGNVDTLGGKVEYIYSSLKWIIGLLGTILIAVLANLLSQPIVNLFG